MTHTSSGIRIKLPKGKTIKDGKIISKPVKLSRPAEHAKRTKRKWKAAR